MIQKLIKEYILESKSKNDEKSNYAIGLATTSYKFDQAYFSFPRKIKDWGYYFHIICPDSESANNVLSYLKHHVDEFFLDMDSVNSKFCTIKSLFKESSSKLLFLIKDKPKPMTLDIENWLISSGLYENSLRQ